MAVYYPEISVKVMSFGLHESPIKYDIRVDAPSFDGLLSDLDQILKEMLAAKLQYFVDRDWESLPVNITVGYDVLSFQKTIHHKLDKKEFDSLKKAQVPDRPPLNPGAIENDIEYGINMIRSFVDIKTDVAMHGVVSWYYHTLLKHFGTPIPKEIMDIHEANMRKLHNKEQQK